MRTTLSDDTKCSTNAYRLGFWGYHQGDLLNDGPPPSYSAHSLSTGGLLPRQGPRLRGGVCVWTFPRTHEGKISKDIPPKDCNKVERSVLPGKMSLWQAWGPQLAPHPPDPEPSRWLTSAPTPEVPEGAPAMGEEANGWNSKTFEGTHYNWPNPIRIYKYVWITKDQNIQFKELRWKERSQN